MNCDALRECRLNRIEVKGGRIEVTEVERWRQWSAYPCKREARERAEKYLHDDAEGTAYQLVFPDGSSDIIGRVEVQKALVA